MKGKLDQEALPSKERGSAREKMVYTWSRKRGRNFRKIRKKERDNRGSAGFNYSNLLRERGTTTRKGEKITPRPSSRKLLVRKETRRKR